MVTIHKNNQVQALIRELKTASATNDADVWHAIACDLERPTRSMPIVNLSKLARFTKQGEVVVVPGKVLGDGELSHTLTVAALSFSGSASQKLSASKSSMLTIQELLKKDPKGKNVRIFA